MTSSASAHRMPGWLVLIGAMSALGPFSIDMYLPGFPVIEREFAEVGVERTMATYLLGIALGQLVYGPVSDRFGRKPPLYFGLTLYVLGAVGCAIATTMTMLMLMRVLQAIGACAPLVIGRAVVRDRCEPHEAARAYSTLMLIVSLGPIIAPTLGGWVITISGWRAVFVFQGAGGVVLIIAMHMMLTESRDSAHVVPLRLSTVLAGYGRLFKARKFIGYSLVGGFAMAGLFCFVTGSPLVMSQVFSLTPQQFGWMIGLNGIAFISASQLNIHALQTSTPGQVLARAVWWPLLFTSGLTLASFALSLPLWAVIVLQFCFFISVGRTNPNVSALALAPYSREAGAASALMGSLQSALGMFAGVLVSIFSNGTVFRLSLLMTGCALMSALSYVWVGERRRGEPLPQ
jgi:DHA1 family bicyclomycin/chloramphenicol resistance-like MFS transporter